MLNQIATDYHDEEDPDAQRWAQEHRRFLEENRPDVLKGLQESGDQLFLFGGPHGERAPGARHEPAPKRHGGSEAAVPGAVRKLQNRPLDEEEVISHDLINRPASEDCPQPSRPLLHHPSDTLLKRVRPSPGNAHEPVR